jgi:hypothetical protein
MALVARKSLPLSDIKAWVISAENVKSIFI